MVQPARSMAEIWPSSLRLQWSDALGGLLWVVGFFCETTADLQKQIFKVQDNCRRACGCARSTNGTAASEYLAIA